MADHFNRDAEFWKDYMRHRPFPPQWLWDRMWSYHAEHNSDFKVAHDGGAGSGVHSHMLAKKFDKVIVSDPNASNIEAGKEHLGNHGGGADYEFHVSKFEELHIEPDASVDLVFLANALHWMDEAKAHSFAARQLKPGGTYIIGLWWDVYFPEHPKIQEICRRMVDQGNLQLTPGPEGSEKWLRWQGLMTMIYSGLASVKLPDEFIPDSVVRIEINREPSMTVHSDQLVEKYNGSKPPLLYRTEHVKDEKWISRTDFPSLIKKHASFSLDMDNPEMQKITVLMKAEFEKAGGTVDAIWQGSLLLATRR